MMTSTALQARLHTARENLLAQSNRLTQVNLEGQRLTILCQQLDGQVQTLVELVQETLKAESEAAAKVAKKGE